MRREAVQLTRPRRSAGCGRGGGGDPPSQELRELLQSNPVPGCTVRLQNDNSLFEWVATMDGPAGTPYAGGHFQIKIKVCWASHTPCHAHARRGSALTSWGAMRVAPRD